MSTLPSANHAGFNLDQCVAWTGWLSSNCWDGKTSCCVTFYSGSPQVSWKCVPGHCQALEHRPPLGARRGVRQGLTEPRTPSGGHRGTQGLQGAAGALLPPGTGGGVRPPLLLPLSARRAAWSSLGRTCALGHLGRLLHREVESQLPMRML